MAKLITRKGRETWSEYVRKNGGKLDKMALDILELHQEDHLSCVALCALKKGGYLIGKHSDKCTFYTLRFDCSFAAANTIKPQLL